MVLESTLFDIRKEEWGAAIYNNVGGTYGEFRKKTYKGGA